MRVALLVCSLAAALPALAAPPSAQIEGAADVVTVTSGGKAHQLFRLAPARSAKIRATGPATARLFFRAAEALPRPMSVLVELDGMPLRPIAVRGIRDASVKSSLAFVGVANLLEAKVPPGKHELRVTWPAKAKGSLLLEVAGLDLTPETDLALPAPPPPPPPPVKSHTVTAYADARPAAEPAPEPAATAEAEAESPGGALRLGLLAGGVVPRTALMANATGLLDAAWRLPLFRGVGGLDGRLRLGFTAGYALLRYQGPAIVPGRGYDPAFIENTTTIPLDLGLRYALTKPGGALDLWIGAAYTLTIATAEFQSFSVTTDQRDAASGVAFGAGLGWRAGPGALVAQLRYAEVTANIGVLGPAGTQVGENRLAGFSIAAGYAMDLF